jgi:tetratricopeptide (TPR) repeat protein
MYEMLTGKDAFGTDSSMEAMGRRMQQVPEPPSKVCPKVGIDEKLDKLVLKCLQPLPENRFQSVSEIENYLRGDMRISVNMTAKQAPPRARMRPRNATFMLARVAAILCLILLGYCFATRDILNGDFVHNYLWQKIEELDRYDHPDDRHAMDLGKIKNTSGEAPEWFKRALAFDEFRVKLGMNKNELRRRKFGEKLKWEDMLTGCYVRYADNLNWRGQPEAEAYYRKAVDILQPVTFLKDQEMQNEQERLLSHLIQKCGLDRAAIFEKRGDFEKALAVELEVLELNNKEQWSCGEEQAGLRGRIADCAAAAGDFVTLRKTARDTIELWIKQEATRSRRDPRSKTFIQPVQACEAYIHFSDAEAAQGRLADALLAATAAIDVYQKNPSDPFGPMTLRAYAATGTCCRVMAQESQAAGDRDRAEKQYEEAVAYHSKALAMAKSDPALAASIDDMEILLLEDQFRRGEGPRFQKQIMAFWHRCEQQNHLGNPYKSAGHILGQIAMNQHRYDDALSIYRHGLDALSKQKPLDQLGVAQYSRAAAQILDLENKKEQAATQFEDAIAHARLASPVDEDVIGDGLLYLSQVYRGKDPAKHEQYQSQAVDAYKKAKTAYSVEQLRKIEAMGRR